MACFVVVILLGIFSQCYGDASKCWTCTNEANFLDCRANGYLATCNSGDTGGCQTEVRNENGNLRITKKCKAKSVCQSEVQACENGYNTAGAICYYCCITDNCNVAIEGECVDDCQHVPEGSYHSCQSCSYYRTCATSVNRENQCAGGLVWNDRSKNCDWPASSKTCPNYNNIGTPEPFKCWTCSSQPSFEACNANGNLQTCNSGDTGGCQTRVSYRDGAVERVTKNCKQQATCQSEATNSDSRCPPSNQVHSASNLDCNSCCTTNKCNYVSTDSCTTNCDGLSVTDYQSCIQCDAYISCSSPITDNRPCAMGQDGNRLLWDNSIPACVASSSTCPAGNSPSVSSGPCDNNPCENNGVCEADGESYTCDCTAGYKGTICNETDECSPDPCDNGGTCTDGDNSYTCECATGYKGTDCDETDECSTDPCGNGGTCTDGDNTYSCECATGYKGTDCDETDECSPDPCANGGTCTDGDNSYTCECATGYKGTDCDVTDECSPDPCDNGGTCTDGDNSYTCACVEGFKGTDCDETDECSPNPCQNSGNCVDGDNTYTCACASGYTGNNCQTESPGATVCDNNPCQNDGTCAVSGNSYTCSCPDGYSGDNCQTSPSVCDNNPCQNDGTCAESGDSYTCSCADGYSGDNCQTESPGATACDNNPCQNDGTCAVSGNSYTCSCPDGYSGDNCQTTGNQTVVTCADSPCQNGGQCTDNAESYTCACTAEYTGTNCDADFLAQVNDDENTEGDTSNTDMIWYIVGAAVAATLVGTGCLVFFLLGRKPKRKVEDEPDPNGMAPVSTVMPPKCSPTPVETVNHVGW